MNNIDYCRAKPTTAIATVVGLTAAMACQATWPSRETPAYTISHSDSSYSSFEKSLVFFPLQQDTEFARRIADFYASLSEGQEPLGAEFEMIWNANAASLYES